MGTETGVNMVAEQERVTEMVKNQLAEAVQGMYMKVRAEIRTEMDKEREVRAEKNRDEYGVDEEEKERKVLLDFKYFKDIDKYGGDETKWTEWMYNLR